MTAERRGMPLAAIAAITVIAAAPAAAGNDPAVALVGRWDGFDGKYADVWAEGTVAFVGHYGDEAVSLVDISDPTAPELLSEFRFGPPRRKATARLSKLRSGTQSRDEGAHRDSPQDVKAANGLMFVGVEEFTDGNTPGTLIVDVRDPSNPELLTRVTTLDELGVHNVFYDAGFLYQCDTDRDRISIVDLTAFDPNNAPATISSDKWTITDVGGDNVHDITVQDGRLYASAWDGGLWIYDVSDVANAPPSFLGSTPGNNTHSAWPTADGKYVVTGEERRGGGITVYRITDTGDSVSLTRTDSLKVRRTSSVHNQMIVGYRLYNSWYEAGLRVYDINPVTGKLSFAGDYDTYGGGGRRFRGAWGIYSLLGPGQILLSDQSRGLFIFSVPPTVEPALQVASAR